MEKKKIFTAPKALNAMSWDRKACGVMSAVQTHTPSIQDRLMSLELLRFIKCKIMGMLKNGITTQATTPIFCIQPSIT